MAYALDGIPFDTLTSPKEGVRRFKVTTRSELTDAMRAGKAGILSCSVEADAGETVALNVYPYYSTVISKVEVIGDYDIIVRNQESTGVYGEICEAESLDLLTDSEDLSQSQVVRSAVNSGNVIANGSVSDSILTNSTAPISVMVTNETESSATIPIFVTFYSVDDDASFTPLMADTALTATTEMSDYA